MKTQQKHDETADFLYDPIIEEVRRAGAELAREANYDLHTLCELLHRRSKRYGKRLVSPEDVRKRSLERAGKR